MTAFEGFVPSWSAEFPNDNPLLHEGATWVCLSVQGPPRAVTRPRTKGPPAETMRASSASILTHSDEAPAGSREAPDVAADGAGVSSEELSASCDVPTAIAVTEAPEPAPSLEALTLAFDTTEVSPFSGSSSCAPLELDAMDFVLTLSSDDAVFDFDADGAPAETTPDDTAHAPACDSDDPVAAVAEPVPAADSTSAATNATLAVVAPAAQSSSVASLPDSFSAYVAAVVEVAEAAGHTRAAATIPRLLEGASLDLASLPDEAQARLVAADVLSRSGGALSPSEAFASMASAWRGVLRGDTHDLSACGESTLDGWSAELLKAFGVGQGSATDVRRELRRRGVAAFGMLLAA